jgi:hypothetical protein
MNYNDALIYSFENVRERVHRVVQGLDAGAAVWRPDADANSIAWLLWHLTRVEDGALAHLDAEQVWDDQWAQRFGLPAGYNDTGYGHSSDDVAGIRPSDPQDLAAYQDTVAESLKAALEDFDDFDRIVDRSYDPPVSAGVRLMSVNGDALQHVGQAAYVRGLYERQA